MSSLRIRMRICERVEMLAIGSYAIGCLMFVVMDKISITNV